MKIILTLILILTGQIIRAGQYYVSTTGNNSNSGSLSFPWLNVQYSIDQLQAGDTLNIVTGLYSEKIHIQTSGILIREYGIGLATLDASILSSTDAIMVISDCSDVTITGMQFQNNIQNDAQGILITGSCNHITLENLIVRDIHFSLDPEAEVTAETNAQAIIVYGTSPGSAISDLTIKDCEVYNCTLGYSEGIAINGNVDGFVITDCYVHNLTNIGIVAIGHEGTCPNVMLDQARHGIVRNNIVHHCISPYATSGGIYTDGAKDIVIENNATFHNGFGIEVGCENISTSSENIIVRNNIVYDNEISGIALGGYDYPLGSGKVMNCSLQNNTCYFNDYSHNGNGELFLTYSENSLIENNIFYCHQNNNLLYAEQGQPGYVFNYNIFYCNDGIDAIYFDWNGIGYEGFNAFVAGTGSNAQSQFVNPLFANPGIVDPDFHLTASSPCIDSGNPSYAAGISETDLDGMQRLNGIIDCGADEYNSLPLGVPIHVKNNLSIYPNPVLNQLNLSGGDFIGKDLYIYDINGRMVHSERILSHSIDAHELIPGMYLLYIAGDRVLLVK
jgi:Right handed beta helix region/Secretion system C-terminal sorting domain